MRKQNSGRLQKPMKHYQMLTGGKSTTLLDTALSLPAKDREAVEVLSSSHLTSISMTYSKTLDFLVKTKTLGLRSTLKITSRHARTVPADRGTISRSSLSEADCLMTCSKTWRKCSLSVALTPLAGTPRIDSVDLASTAGLSLSAEAIWSLRTLTVRDSSFLSVLTKLVDCSSKSMMQNSFL